MFIKIGRAVVYDRTDLDRWISTLRVANTGQRAAA
jgi:hypothetical protein